MEWRHNLSILEVANGSIRLDSVVVLLRELLRIRVGVRRIGSWHRARLD